MAERIGSGVRARAIAVRVHAVADDSDDAHTERIEQGCSITAQLGCGDSKPRSPNPLEDVPLYVWGEAKASSAVFNAYPVERSG